MIITSTEKHSCRKWSGVVWLMVEMNLIAGTIFGFAALFRILPDYGVYDMYCTSSENATNGMSIQENCDDQTKQYQNALTLGIIFFGLPSVFVGAVIDRFGCRFVKVIAIIFYIVGWLALALVQSGRDYLLFIHTAFSSIGGVVVLITTYASSNYFSKSRAFVSALFAGATISSTMWFSVFQALIDDDRITLAQLSYIWMSFGFLMLISSFLYLDWEFPLLNLPYRSDVKLEQPLTTTNEPSDKTVVKTRWYVKMYQRTGIWEYLTSPLYILLVLFLSILLIPTVFLSVTWHPWVYYITKQNTSLANQYTFAFNLTTLSALAICPVNGFLLGFRADRSRKQKLLNISIVQTVAWLSNVALCIICMFVTTTVIIPALVINCIARATIVSGSQAVLATFFPSKYIGRLTGIMWTTGGAITLVQYGLVKLTDDVSKSWIAWVIVLALVVIMSCHLVQIWFKYIKERKTPVPETEVNEA